jgi:Tol biopolymer transport system component
VYKGGDDALQLIDPRGGQSKILVSRGTFGRVVSVGGWSADSRKIYFRVLAADGSLNIAQVSVDGSNPSLVVRFDDRQRRSYRPDFTTDGKTIYFTIGRHEADIWVMDLKKK